MNTYEEDCKQLLVNNIGNRLTEELASGILGKLNIIYQQHNLGANRLSEKAVSTVVDNAKVEKIK